MGKKVRDGQTFGDNARLGKTYKPGGSAKGKFERAKTFTPWQILTLLHQVNGGHPVRWLAQQHGISPTTISRWHAKFGHETAHVQSALMAQDIGELRQVVGLLRRQLKAADKAVDTIRSRMENENGKYAAHRIRQAQDPKTQRLEGWIAPPTEESPEVPDKVADVVLTLVKDADYGERPGPKTPPGPPPRD